MNFCTNCGNKLNKGSNFCTNCGKKISESKEVKKSEKKEIKDFNVNNLVLYVGVALVILSTFIFAICTWENMSGLFKISFLTFETLLFFIISFVFAKIKNNGLSKAFYMMAVLMIPVILYTIPVYSLLGNYLSYEGAGIFVYLAISNLICASVYLLSYFLLNVKAYTFISYAFIYALIMCIFLAFERSMEFVIISTLVFVLLAIIVNFINNKDNFFRRSITWFTSILFSLFSIFMIGAIFVTFTQSYITGLSSINIYLILITILYLVDTFIFIYQNRKHVFKYVSPIVTVPVIYTILTCSIENRVVLSSVFAGACLVIYLLFLIYKDTYLKTASKIITYISLYLMIAYALCNNNYYFIYSYEYYLILGIVSIFTLGFNLINRFTEKNPIMSDILVPLSSIFIVVGFSKYYIYQLQNNLFLTLLIATVLIVVYMFLRAFNSKNNKIYYIYSMVALIMSMFMCNSYTDGLLIIFLNVLLLILFIFVSFTEKSRAINVITYITLVFSIIEIRFLIDIDVRILFACISFISIIVGIILTITKVKLNKFYLYFGEILALLLSLVAFIEPSNILIALVGVLFVVCFISIVLFNNTNTFRIISELLGMLLIFNILNTLISVTLFSTLISLFLYMSILVILGLTGKEKGWTIILLSTVCLIPYYDLVLSSNTDIPNQLFIIPFIVYLFVLTFYFKMKEQARMHTIIWPLMVFSTLAINTTTIGIIVALGLALSYIFIGIFKKYRYLVTFGIIYIFVIVVFELFKMFNNIALLVAVLAVGLALIIYVVINEVYKTKKNK